KVVHAPNDLTYHLSVKAKMPLENKGIFEWDIIIEKDCWSWVGVCATEIFHYESWAGSHLNGWVLGSNGNCYNSCNNILYNYCPPFGDGTKITVHLDISKRRKSERTCSFTVNGKKYPEVSGWNNLP